VHVACQVKLTTWFVLTASERGEFCAPTGESVQSNGATSVVETSTLTGVAGPLL
jgi:hypothetical protein